MKSILSLVSVLLLATASEAATIAPHRAIYDLTLLRANEGATVQSANGKLAFEIEGSTCEGFTVSFRMATRYQPEEGSATLIDTATTTFEGPGALEFRHQLKETIDGSVKEDMRIKMTRDSVDKAGEGVIATKPDEPFSIPAGAMLPMQHQLRLMALGETGGGRDSSVIYDGSDGPQSFRAISFVGKQKLAGAISRDAENTAAGPLKAAASWPMTVSYFKIEGDSDTPEYQVSFNMYENGVATGLVLDYGDFALSGTLRDLKMLDKPDCH